LSLHLDEYGFLWHHAPATPITDAVHQQRDQDAARAREQAEKKRAAEGPEADQSEDKPKDTTTIRDTQGGPASNLRKRPGKAKVEDATPTPSPGRRRTPPIKKPKLEAPSPGAQETTDMDKVYGQLNVINTKTARRRAASLKQQGKQEAEALSPNRMPIPVANTCPCFRRFQTQKYLQKSWPYIHLSPFFFLRNFPCAAALWNVGVRHIVTEDGKRGGSG
jgi:hypothetical protein